MRCLFNLPAGGLFVSITRWILAQQHCPTYTLSCTASVCFRARVTLPTEISCSLTMMPGWYMWQKYCTWTQTDGRKTKRPGLYVGKSRISIHIEKTVYIGGHTTIFFFLILRKETLMALQYLLFWDVELASNNLSHLQSTLRMRQHTCETV